MPMGVSFRGDRRPAATGLRAAVLALVLVFAAGGAAPAAGPQQTATQFVQSMADRVLAVIRDKGVPASKRKVLLKKIFLDAFDTQAIGRFALGRYWRTATPAQRAEYMRLFPGYVADIYAGQFSTYSGEKFVAIRSSELGKGRAVVNAEIRRTNGTKIAVDFRVKHEGNGYRVIDAVVEGVSLIVTKRDEFAAVVARQGVDALLKRMRNIVESG